MGGYWGEGVGGACPPGVALAHEQMPMSAKGTAQDLSPQPQLRHCTTCRPGLCSFTTYNSSNILSSLGVAISPKPVRQTRETRSKCIQPEKKVFFWGVEKEQKHLFPLEQSDAGRNKTRRGFSCDTNIPLIGSRSQSGCIPPLPH